MQYSTQNSTQHPTEADQAAVLETIDSGVRFLSRRDALALLTAAPAFAAFLAACGSDDEATGAAATGSAATDTDSGTQSESTQSENTQSESSDQAEEPSDSDSAAGWAVGGTALITASYPDDSIFDAGGTCEIALTEETTLGPCYFADDTGEDISTGLTGLPMQLCLRVVDADCQPLADHVVEVWHCDTRGVYSGDTSASADASSFAGDFCTGGDDSAAQSNWYRGQLTSDASGRVNFKSCFPGWYRGRTIHIHFAVSEPGGPKRLISQFCFTDEFAREICTTHELYSDRGEQDTPLAGGDTVFPSSGYESFVLTTQQNSDGSLLAYHTIQVT